MNLLTLLQINDLHGYLTPHPELFHGLNGPFQSGGGLARVATIFKNVRREVDGAVVALDSGDTFHGSMEAVLTQGEALVGPMSLLGLDGMTAHWEFAYGLDRVRGLEKHLPYPILATNCEDASGELMFPPFTVLERGGVKVGIIGLAAVVAPKLLPAHDRPTVRLTIGGAALRSLIPVLRRDKGVGLVVVLSHLGLPQDCKLARAVSGIDVLVSGHTHNRLEQPVIVNDTLVIQSGAHGSFVGRLDLEMTNGSISSWRHRLLTVDDAMEADGDMTAAVDQALSAFTDARTRVVGTTRTPLTRYTMIESTMDNLLLAAVAAAAETPIALSNGWRYGAPIPAGTLTESDLWNIVPANPAVSLVTLTAGELRTLFEDNLDATFACDPWQQRGGYLKRCRGIQLAIKLENPKRHRIQEFRVGGERLRAGASYRLAFLGEQGVPEQYGSDRRSIGVTAIDALRHHLARHDSVQSELTHALTLV